MSSSRKSVLVPVDLTSVPEYFRIERFARFHVELPNRTVFEDLAVAHREDLAFDRLLFGGVRDDIPPLLFSSL